MSKEKTNPVMGKCATCKHWKNNQAELDYNKFKGICVNPLWKFDINNTGDIMILDRANRSDKFMGVNRFESVSTTVPIGKVTESRYCLVTDEAFGCVHHQNK